MARCRFGNLAAFQWKCAAVPARRQFGLGAGFFADMLVYMHKPRASKRKIKSAEGLPKNMRSDSVLFGRLPLAFLWSIGLSMDASVDGEMLTRHPNLDGHPGWRNGDVVMMAKWGCRHPLAIQVIDASLSGQPSD